ncbi:CC/Se motif family (seleno)protein [Halovibrio sp. HP20-50]|uniref:CC/Se motif family (seleno)protein n=1 Tax=Halovibrio sp. HP20-59 TaxID=3080275 RepID=UPI00294B7FC7|nr:CC/Se motif family (seleno)protein [Halovibrio sp. HP20-59]MEA2119353.1 CC/Se motif family (seleno)protein [Halovibrio sp. HP20-59]
MNNVIDISSDALDFIKQQGGVVTVRLSPRYGCCGGSANVAVAEATSPADPSLYQRHCAQAITLFIESALADQGLCIDVEGFWKLRHLYVSA